MKNLKKLRLNKNLSQAALAKILHVSQSSIHAYEAESKEASCETAARAADYFNVTVDYLLGREPESGLIYVHKDPALLNEEKELLRLYKTLKPDLRETAVDIIRAMANKS